MDIPKSLFFSPVVHFGGAWSGHLPFAYDLIAAFRPKLLVELGSHRGESYFSFCKAISDHSISCKSFAVDTWQGDPHAGFYSEQIFNDFTAINQKSFAAFSTMVRATFDEALGKFADGSIDLLHIDGLHTYDAVRHDFQTWLPKLSPAGIVLFHDTTVREQDFGVWKFWSEIKSDYPTFEFTHSNGLGVLFNKQFLPRTDLPDLLAALLDPGRHAEIRRIYETLSRLINDASSLTGTTQRYEYQIHKLNRELQKSRRLFSFYPTRQLLKSLRKKLAPPRPMTPERSNPSNNELNTAS